MTREAGIFAGARLALRPGRDNAQLKAAVEAHKAGRLASAEVGYRRVLRQRPDDPDALMLLGVLSWNSGDNAVAERLLRQALKSDPEYDLAYGALALLLGKQGRLADAAEVYRAWYASDPANSLAKHMLAATSGVDTPERAAPEYVRHMFDLLAADFDRHLGELGYRAPELVTERLRSRLDAGFRPDVLDAGCGTGLAGPLLRKFSNRVVGVDLSPGMIEKAHARGTYDELVVQEISEFMRSRPDTFDVVICVDTFIYFGVIDEPLRAARTCLHPRGLLAFTTECLEDSAPYRLQSHGRYAHSESYIRQTTAQTGFTEVTLETRAIRREHGKDVPGYVVLAQAESA